jgi:hypothetical protein
VKKAIGTVLALAVVAGAIWAYMQYASRSERELESVQQETAQIKGQKESDARRDAVLKLRNRIVCLAISSEEHGQKAWKAFMPLAVARFDLARETKALLPKNLHNELVEGWFEQQTGKGANKPPKDLAKAAWDLMDITPA